VGASRVGASRVGASDKIRKEDQGTIRPRVGTVTSHRRVGAPEGEAGCEVGRDHATRRRGTGGVLLRAGFHGFRRPRAVVLCRSDFSQRTGAPPPFQDKNESYAPCCGPNPSARGRQRQLTRSFRSRPRIAVWRALRLRRPVMRPCARRWCSPSAALPLVVLRGVRALPSIERRTRRSSRDWRASEARHLYGLSALSRRCPDAGTTNRVPAPATAQRDAAPRAHCARAFARAPTRRESFARAPSRRRACVGAPPASSRTDVAAAL